MTIRVILMSIGVLFGAVCSSLPAGARENVGAKDTSRLVLGLEDALKIALCENISVKVADKEVERAGYAKKGTYASLFPKIDIAAVFQRTIKKQVMYMDFDMSKLMGGSGTGSGTGTGKPKFPSSKEGIEVGRWNTYNGGISASMPLVNAQLWKSLDISGSTVELAVEKARSSRLEMVTQVKQAYFSVLLAKEAFNVYKSVYDNAQENFKQTEKRYKAFKASELEYTRAKANVANAIPNLYNAESSIVLGLWQLKAVIGIDLDRDIDVSGALDDYSGEMLYDFSRSDSTSVDRNTVMRQLSIQAEQLAQMVKLKQYAYLPSLAANFSYSMNAMANDFKFSEYRWTPHSYVGISLAIPVFSGGKRYNDVRQAKVQATELDLQRINTERQLKIAIRQYTNTMETNFKSYAAAQEAVGMAQKAYDISETSYNLGKSTLTDLNDAQLVLTRSRLAEAQAIFNFIVAKAKLEQTIGYDFINDDGSANLDTYSINSLNNR